ncbi:Mitogen-activated protein kinase kinase 4 [Fagus crenata]
MSSALREALPQKPSELHNSASTGLVTSKEIQPIDGFRCFLYCTLFPLGYEFEKDTLIQLWMAEGFIEERTNERLEDTGSIVFHSFVSKGFIVPLSCDFNDGSPKYKVSDNNISNIQQFSLNRYLLVEDVVPGFNLSDKWGDTSQLSHLSLHGKIDLTTFEAIKQCEYLRTLLINPRHDSCIKLVPRDLFLRLNLLRALKLSQTHISQLPSSIANVKSLRYIDVSETPIITLPESIGSLHKLQTLKLRGCTCFVALPKGMKNLTKLRHLDLDIVGQLSSMPSGMGNLINLQNLSGFIVDRDDGFHICELKNLNNLRGEICISRLERVPNSEEAMEAALLNKNYLNKLELRWSDLRVEEAEVEEGILECLQPHSGLKELHILFYGGSKLPSWFGHPSFADLTAITLYKFKNCQFLPSLGELPSLKFLYIAEMNTVSEVDYRFCRNREDQGHHAFPKLEILKFDVMLKLEGWMGVQNGDFPSLVKLTLVYCPKLNTLPTLSCLNSLKHLEIKHCPKLISMPNEGLPSSLEFLLIKDCPELKEHCSKGKGQDWCKIAHVPSIWVDNQEISAT